MPHTVYVLTTDELLAQLRKRGIRNADAARALNIPDSRIAELHGGRRSLRLDEAAKLVAAFNLGEEPSVSDEVTVVLIKHVAGVLGKALDDRDPRIGLLTADLKAFAQFQADPSFRNSAEAAEGFLRGLGARRA